MENIARRLTQLVGKTPLLELSRYEEALNLPARLVGKLECFNPLGSVKDRIALAMIEKAEEDGLLDKDTVIVEATSGNTGIGLAFVAATRGYRLVLCMPESMTRERRSLLIALGAELVLTSATLGMKGAVRKAEEVAASIPKSFIPAQFENPANVAIHYNTTAEEIWADTDGKIAAFVSGVGTGGTITGVGKRLKELNPLVKVYAAEPFSSPVLSGGKAGSHKIQGIGAGFVPNIFDNSYVDGIIKVRDEEAMRTARQLAALDGLLVGISSGAATFAAQKVARYPEHKGKLVLAILPDTGERYLSTELFSEVEPEYLEPRLGGAL
jgi:cysteine synthase A